MKAQICDTYMAEQFHMLSCIHYLPEITKQPSLLSAGKWIQKQDLY